MRFWIFVLVMVAVCIPALLLGETLFLTDGSTLKGKLVKFQNDTLHFETAFGATVKIPKQMVKRLDFVEGGVDVSMPAMVDAGFENTVLGTLQVFFDKVSFTSRISVERDRDREAIERENSIEQALLVGDRKIYSYVDSTTDKVVRKGPETVLRNDFTAVDLTVALEPDLYHTTLVIGNTLADEYADRFDSAPLDRRLMIDNVRIDAGKTTRIRVGLKRKKWGVSKSELFVAQ